MNEQKIPFLYNDTERSPRAETRMVASAIELSPKAGAFVAQFCEAMDSAYDQACRLHRDYINELQALAPKPGGHSKALVELDSMIAKLQAELDVANVRIDEIPEIDSLKMQIRIQNWLGIGLVHEEMIAKIGDDARLLAAYREILQCRDNNRDARDVSDRITEIMAPGAKEKLFRLKEARRNLIDYERRYLFRWAEAIGTLSWRP